MRLLSFILAIACCVLSSYAGNSQGLYFNRYDIRNGLTQNTVFCILQDRIGFMWFGTKDGLNRFDGSEFKTFIKGDNDEWNCSYVSALYEASDGRIWIGTDKGVCIYSPETETIEQFSKTMEGGVGITNTVTRIMNDRKGNIYIVVEGDGIYKYNPGKDKLEYCRVASPDYDRINITSLAFEESGRIWMGTFGRGLFYSDDNLKTMHQFTDSQGGKPFARQVVTKILEKSGLLYVAIESQGLRVIDCSTNKVSDIFTKDERGGVPYVRDFLFVDDNVWTATEAGLYVYDLVTRTYRHYRHSVFDPYSLSDNAIYAIYKDRENGMWMGTYFGGVSYLPNKGTYFNKFYQTGLSDSFKGQQVREFCKDNNGNIWIGTEDAGLNKYNTHTHDFGYVEESRNFSNVHGLCLDGNNLLVGTFSHGLKIIDTVSGKVVRSFTLDDGSGLNSNYVFTIFRTRENEIYIGTMSGLQLFDIKSGKFETIQELRDVFIQDIYEDTSGNLWVATYVNGLYRRDAAGSMWRRYVNIVGDSSSIPSNRVLSVYEDLGRRIWVTTQSGICSFNPKNNNFDRSILGLEFPQGVVYQIQEDRNGNYWVTTNHGLYQVDCKEKKVDKFTTSDGLLSNQFNYNSSFQDKDGRIYFGCIGGFISFEPKSIKPDEKLPAPVFVDMWLNNNHINPGTLDSPLANSISMTKRVELASDQNFVSFKVVVLSYDNLVAHRIKYKLEGFDNDWNYLPPNNRISYSNLSYGKYVLKVMSYNEKDEENGSVTELEIIINPPFYLSVWAYLLYIIAAICLIYAIVRRNKLRNLRRNREQMEKYKQEKEKEVYDAKFEFFTNVAHEIRTPLTLIKAPLESVMKKDVANDKSVKEDLDIMNMNVERLLFLTNQLLDFRKIESRKFKLRKERCNVSELLRTTYTRFVPTAGSENMKFNLKLPKKDLYAVVDPEAVTKIISNLFTNAVKYGDTYIDVSLSSGKDGSFSIEVCNDGPVIAPDKREEVFSTFTRLDKTGQNGVGIGLAFARSLAVLHGGSLNIADSDSENIFVLTLPIDAEDSEDKPVAEGEELGSLGQLLRKNDKLINVLVVEDSVEMRRFIEKSLIENNYNVLVASNGKEALKVLKDNPVNIVVSDIMMPEMDGYELLKAVKTDIMYSHIPVILLTAKTNLHDKIEGLELGADAYIDKPFSMPYLLASISSLVRNAERLRESLAKMPFAASGKEDGLSKMDAEFLAKLNEVIQENYSNPDFSMDDVVEIMNMSRSSFYRKMKGILDLTPNDYIRIERLKKAAQLLKEGSHNVTEICYMVGFSSPSYFAKCFNKQYGVLPKDYVG